MQDALKGVGPLIRHSEEMNAGYAAYVLTGHDGHRRAVIVVTDPLFADALLAVGEHCDSDTDAEDAAGIIRAALAAQESS